MKKLVCIVCPNSCELEITQNENGISVSGNKCKRGITFATDEMTAPEIPKERIFDVMNEINHVTVKKRLKRGDVVIKNVLSLGVDVIATSGVLSELPEEEKQARKPRAKKAAQAKKAAPAGKAKK